MIFNFRDHFKIACIRGTKLWDAYSFGTNLVIHSITWLFSYFIYCLVNLGVCVSTVCSFFFLFSQITEKKNELGKLESIDCGKPLDEALADLVISIIWLFFIGKIFTNDTMHFLLTWDLLWFDYVGWCYWLFWVLCWACWRVGCKAKGSCISSFGDLQELCSQGAYWCCCLNYSMVSSFSSF